MNWKSTWVWVVVAALAFAFIEFVEQPWRRARELQASRIVLPGLNPSQVTNIEIHPWGQPVIQAVRTNSGSQTWRLVRPLSYGAQNQRIGALLESLARLEWVDRVSERELISRPNAQEEFGFTNPCYTLLLQGSGTDRRLEFGDLGAFGDTVSLQVVGNTAIYQADAEILRLLSPDKNQWRDPFLLNLTNLSFQTLRVRAPGKEFDLERDATHHLWFMRWPLSARGDSPKINDLLERLQATFVSAFVTDNPQADLDSYGLQSSETTPELAISFLDRTNIVAGVQVGRSPTNYPDYAFARRNDTGNIVLVAREPMKPWLAPYTDFLDAHFISQSPALIDSISVRGVDDFVVRKQTNGPWLVVAGKSFPADEDLMGYWLASFTNVATAIAKTVVTDFAVFGLSNAALRYTVHFGPAAAAQTEAHIDFGTNPAGSVFERRLGEDFVNTISRGDYEVLPRVSWELRDRKVWSFRSSNVVSVTIHQLGGTLKYLRDPDGNWTYAPGFNSQVPINSPAVEECVLRIGQLRAVYWDGVGEEHLERFGFGQTRHEVEFEARHGATNELFQIQFGGQSPYLHHYASVIEQGQRLIFEFPVDLYSNLVEPNLTLYTARRQRH